MNNAFVLKEEVLVEEATPDIAPMLRKRAEDLVDIIEALRHVAGSSYWKVLRQHEFDISPLLVELGEEKEPVKIYRLQGEIRRAKKLDLENLLAVREQELERIKQKLT
jgi:hypothetical protein